MAQPQLVTISDLDTALALSGDEYLEVVQDGVSKKVTADMIFTAGQDGLSAYQVALQQGYQGTEAQWLLSLKGTNGSNGAQGIQGPQGGIGATGAKGDQGDVGPKGDQGNQGIQGTQGIQGIQGIQGPKGDRGEKGDVGPGIKILATLADEADLPDAEQSEVGDAYLIDGHFWIFNEVDGWVDFGSIKGDQGDSAYQVAVILGYEGTAAEWLTTLKGNDGIGLQIRGSRATTQDLPISGNTNGDAYIVAAVMWVWDGDSWEAVGQVGPPGKSAYQSAVEAGDIPPGTPTLEWIQSLRGKSAYQIAVDGGFVGNQSEWIASLEGEQGIQGAKGDKGDIGDTGPSAAAIKVLGIVDAEGDLPATDNEPGDAYFIELTLYVWTGLAWENVGEIRGEVGPQGDVGPQGPAGPKGDAGPSAYQAAVDEGFVGGIGAWIASLRGPQGLPGNEGPQGLQGPTGPRGLTGETGVGLIAHGPAASFASLPPPSPENLGWVINTLDSGHQYVSDGTSWIDNGDIRGEQGIQGPQGIQGTKGDKGDRGDDGTDGTNGTNFVILGSVATVGALPANAPEQAAYIVSASNHLYIRISGVWQDFGPFTGPKGDTGETGAKGDTGATGAQGPIGASFKYLGSKASQAALPATGNTIGDAWTALDNGHLWIYNGATYVDAGQQTGRSAYQLALDTGFSGSQAAWIASLQGVQGEQGLTGPQGPIGPQGIQGIQGEIGDTGPQGAGVQILGKLASTANLPNNGTLGQGYIIGLNFWVWTGATYEDVGAIQGPKGDRGLQGIQGTQGNTGIQGPKGDQGVRGTIWIALPRAPGPVDGTVGDYFINTVNNSYFYKNTTTAWLALGNLGAGNVFDAPSDDVRYVRLNGAWTALTIPVGEAPTGQGKYYVRRNSTWIEIPAPMTEVPVNNDVQYARKNGAWTPIDLTAIDQYTVKVAVATATLDLATASVFTVDASVARTLAFANVPGATRAKVVVVKVAGNAGVITWPGGIGWSGAAAPSLGAVYTNVVLLWDGAGWTGSVGASA